MIDSDGHYVEYLPLVKDFLREIAGEAVAGRLEQITRGAEIARGLEPGARRQLAIPRIPFWGLPTRNTLDRATAMLPRLLHERLPSLGIDFALLYPTYGLIPIHLVDDELRRASCRAFNRYAAECYADYRDRLAPVAAIPMGTPEEAIDELDHAVGELGLRAVMLAAYATRPYAGEHLPRGAVWLDFFGFDSPYDYDPVWRRCEALGVSPSFHSTGMGWGSRASTSNYVYNHIGSFAASAEGACRAILLSGVPWRFPKLRFAFLEGGVAWATTLLSDVLGHWEKRNRDHIAHYDPAALDRPRLEGLFRSHAPDAFLERMEALDEGLSMLSDPAEDRSGIDEFARCPVEKAQEWVDVFAERFAFGCEADDPMNALAFASALSPRGARLRAIFSSDIGHWDVPEIDEVLPEAWELVEKGLLGESDFRDFTFAYPASHWTAANADFFVGTAVECEVGSL